MKIKHMRRVIDDIELVVRRNGRRILRCDGDSVPEYKRRLFQRQYEAVARLPRYQEPRPALAAWQHFVRDLSVNMAPRMFAALSAGEFDELSAITWRSLDDEEKRRYYHAAREDLIRFTVQLYNYKMELDKKVARLVNKLGN